MKRKCSFCHLHKHSSLFVPFTHECKACKKKDVRKLVMPYLTRIRKAREAGKLAMDYFWDAPTNTEGN